MTTLLVVVDDEPKPLRWLVEKTVTIYCVNVFENGVWSVGTTEKELVEMWVPNGTPLANSLISAWGAIWIPAGKKIGFFATINGEIVAKLA